MATGKSNYHNSDHCIILFTAPLRYDLDDNPSGASFTRSVCPNKTPLGTFTDNVAHTCSEFGFRIWESYTPFVSYCITMVTILNHVTPIG